MKRSGWRRLLRRDPTAGSRRLLGQARRSVDAADQAPGQARSTFGEPLTYGHVAEMAALPERAARLASLGLNDQTIGEVVAGLRERVNADLELMRATGRWRLGHPDPVEFVPGDVVVLRALAVQGLVSMAVFAHNALHPLRRGALPEVDYQQLAGALHDHTVTATWTLDAVPFFLPVTTAVGILASHPPDTDLLASLRLPFPVVTVWFGADLEIDPRLVRWSDMIGSPQRREATMRTARAAGHPDPAGHTHDLATALRTLGGHLTGVTMFAGQDGGIADDVGFVVATNPDPSLPGTAAKDRMRGVIDGRLSRSTLAPLVANLAAAVSWGDWSEPTARAAPPGVPGSRAWRKAVTSPAHRYDERRGAFAGVRVLDTSRARADPPAVRADSPGRARPSPATHLRRGHWRRVRVGRRDDWQYEGRWIAPTVVNPGGPMVAGTAVYRLPVPDAARSALGVDPDDPTGAPSA